MNTEEKRINAILGQRIIKLRHEHNLTQKELSGKLKIDRATLVQMENGNRRITVFDAMSIANYFKISLTNFLLWLK